VGFMNVQRTQRFCSLQNCLNLSLVCGCFRDKSSLGTGLEGAFAITDSLTQAKQLKAGIVATIKKGWGVSNLGKQLTCNPLFDGDFTDMGTVSRMPLFHGVCELLGDVCNGTKCGRAVGSLFPE